MSQQKNNLFYSPQVKTSITKKFGEKKINKKLCGLKSVFKSVFSFLISI